MSLQSKIRDDMVAAMKTRDTEVVSLLRVVAGEFGREMNNGIELEDNQVITILKRMKKDAKTMGNHGEVLILNKYLPEMLDEEQTRVVITEIIEREGYSGMQDMGKVMKEIRKPVTTPQGDALIDGKLASEIVKDLLSK